MNDRGVEVMGERCGGADRQAGDDSENSRKSYRGDKGEKDVAAERLREKRRAHVVTAVARDVVASYNGRRAETKESRHDIKAADQHHGPDHTDARRLRIRHGVETHQNMGQTSGPENEGH